MSTRIDTELARVTAERDALKAKITRGPRGPLGDIDPRDIDPRKLTSGELADLGEAVDRERSRRKLARRLASTHDIDLDEALSMADKLTAHAQETTP